MLGNFSVKRRDGSFSKLPPDQVVEQIFLENTTDHIQKPLIKNLQHS